MLPNRLNNELIVCFSYKFSLIQFVNGIIIYDAQNVEQKQVLVNAFHVIPLGIIKPKHPHESPLC